MTPSIRRTLSGSGLSIVEGHRSEKEQQMGSDGDTGQLPPDVALALKEYESVRREEIAAMQSHVSTLRYAITGSVVLFGIAAQQHADKYLGWAIALALLPLVILFSAVIWMGEYERMARAGRYIALAEERINGLLGEGVKGPLRWESWLREGGSSQSRLVGGHHRYLMIVCVLAALQIAAVAMGLHFYWHQHAHDPSREWLVPTAVAVNLAILLTLLGYFRSSYERLRDFTSDPEERGRRVRPRLRIRLRLYGALGVVAFVSAPIYSWPLGLWLVHLLNDGIGNGQIAWYWSAVPTAIWIVLVPMIASRAVMNELLHERVPNTRNLSEGELALIEDAAADMLTEWEKARLRVLPSVLVNSPSIARNKKITITSTALALGSDVRGPVAHEIGHHRLGHLHPLAISYLYMWPYLYYDREVIRGRDQANGPLGHVFWGASRGAFTVLALPGWIAWVLIRLAWRTAEYDADRFACKAGAADGLGVSLEHERERVSQREHGPRALLRLALARVEEGRALGYLPLPNEHPSPSSREAAMRRWLWQRKTPGEGFEPEGPIRLRRRSKTPGPVER
jgi:Zn-dependent protease with chaperone function